MSSCALSSLLTAAALCGPASAFVGSPRAGRLGTALSAGLLNRGKQEEEQKLDKRGFPVGDPRAKGGTEQDVGLQVGPLMWRWPTQWPYPSDFYDVENNATSLEYFAANPSPGPFLKEPELSALAAHLERHVPKGARILDLGAGAASPGVPASLEAKEVVGVGASAADMDANPLLTGGRVVLDLNAGDSLRLPFEDGSFDAVVCTCAMEYLTEPRAVFWEVFRVLKTGGTAQVVFVSKGNYEGGEDKMAKYWGEFNDAQKMYVAGSFFQFTSGGWSQLKGYDLSQSSGKTEEKKNPLANLLGKKDEEAAGAEEEAGLFVVSGVKASKPPPDASPLRTMQAELWEEKALLPDERRLCCERLYQQYQGCKTPEAGAVVLAAVKELAPLYDALSPMAKVLPVPIRACLAANLAPALAAEGADKARMVAALKEGLGLDTPQEAFWKPLGSLTSKLIAEDKIWLLLDFVPFFATPEAEAKLKDFPEVLNATQAAVSATVPDLSEGDVQLLAVDLAVTDYLGMADHADGQLDMDGFLPWVKELAPYQLREVLEERKAFSASSRPKKEEKK